MLVSYGEMGSEDTGTSWGVVQPWASWCCWVHVITATLHSLQGLRWSCGPRGEGLQAQQVLAWEGGGQGPGS